MIKVRITHLKAPWPKGAQVGDVVEMDNMRAWAVGKCLRVGDDEQPTVEWPADDAAASPEVDEVERIRQEAHAALGAAHAEFAARAQEMDLRLGAASAQATKMAGERDAAVVSADKLRAELAEATAQIEALRAQLATKPAETKAKAGK
jgi:hypothetical protein